MKFRTSKVQRQEEGGSESGGKKVFKEEVSAKLAIGTLNVVQADQRVRKEIPSRGISMSRGKEA